MTNLADALHSRLVAGLRLLLPLLALGVLSTLFLFSRDIDPSRALPYAAVDAEDLARDPRITAPRLTGVTEDGTAVTLIARTVRIASGTGESVEAETVEAAFEAPDGRRTTVTARSARLDRAADLLTLDGEVRLEGPAGYVVEADTMLAALDRSWIASPGPVRALTPTGRLQAGGMVLSAASDAAGRTAAERLLFTDGVRLLHHPDSGD